MIDHLPASALETTPELEDFHMSADPTAPGYHEPVLINEVLEQLQPGPGMVIFDGTLGGGGHSKALLEAGATVVATDQDPEAIISASDALGSHPGRLLIRKANFAGIDQVLAEVGIAKLHGALLDLGVSSHQLDTPERGFSFQRDGALDMRMSPDSPLTAADLVNTASEEQLAKIFREFGEEPAARRIAARIVRERARSPFTHTLQFADLVASVIPRKGRIHPATRAFMALRMAVNRELEILSKALASITAHLAPGGRFAVISFHSGEDRIVKGFMRERSAEWIDRPEWPAPRRNPACIFRPITSRPIVATQSERDANPRARSAKLRVVERLPDAR
jgi:16S rRNA (cytosine1402-N4)-methyltransferase